MFYMRILRHAFNSEAKEKVIIQLIILTDKIVKCYNIIQAMIDIMKLQVTQMACRFGELCNHIFDVCFF